MGGKRSFCIIALLMLNTWHCVDGNKNNNEGTCSSGTDCAQRVEPGKYANSQVRALNSTEINLLFFFREKGTRTGSHTDTFHFNEKFYNFVYLNYI